MVNKKQKNRARSLKTHWFKRQWQRRWLRRTIYVLLFISFLTVTSPWWNPVVFPPVKDPVWGVSFSVKRTRELGLDARQTMTALLDDMKIKHYRLMSYWDEIEVARGQMDFTELDWQMNEVAKRGGSVSLGIGLRQPRWPECHQPEWAFRLSGNEWKQALYAFMEVVAKRYEHHPALISWQLENEAVNDWFGTCDKPDRERLNEEYALLKSWSNKPVWMSLSDQHGFPINPPRPDRFGYSVYRWVWNDKTQPGNYLIYPTPIWYHRLRAVIIKSYTERDIFIHELQMEPWGPVSTALMTTEEQDISMSADQVGRNFKFGRMIGERDIYLWGGEWWYWRLINGDDSIWQAVKTELNRP